MTKEEYAQKMKELTEEVNEKKKRLAKDYALSNNVVKIGDIVEDHISKIKVEFIYTSLSGIGGYPCCIYRGLVINKNGSLSKRGEKRDIYQMNLIN